MSSIETQILITSMKRDFFIKKKKKQSFWCLWSLINEAYHSAMMSLRI
jgi:hypothetical protein